MPTRSTWKIKPVSPGAARDLQSFLFFLAVIFVFLWLGACSRVEVASVQEFLALLD